MIDRSPLNAESLPHSWMLTTLGAVVDYGNAKKAEPSEILDDDWILELEDIEKDSSRLLQQMTFSQRESKSTKNCFNAGDVLYGKLRPYLNKVLIAKKSGYCTTEIVPIQVGVNLDARYLFYWLKHPVFLDYVEAESHGMNMPRLGTETAKAAPFVLAPLKEQRRIANQLDTLLARVNACNDRFASIPALLKRFRQEVLDSAASGLLTQEWRAEQSMPAWVQSKVGVCGIVSGGLTKNTRRHELSLKKPYLRVANVYTNRLDLSDVSEIGLTESEHARTKLQSGDILIVEGNGSLEQLGRVALWSAELDDCVHQNHLIRWRTNGALPRWMLFWLMSPVGRSSLMDRASTTTGLHTLSISKIASVPVNLPSIAEQSEIVRRVDALLKLADRVETYCTAARTHAQRLTSTLLAKAFRGELVPQDPNDEPASALLARIAAERAIAAATPKTKKPSAPRTVRAPKENTTMTKSRHDNDVQGRPYLASHLRRFGRAASAEELFKAAELPVADFYKQLAWEVAQGHVKDGRTVLEAGDAA